MTEELVDLIMDQEEKDQMKEDSSMTMMSVPKEGEGDSAIEMLAVEVGLRVEDLLTTSANAERTEATGTTVTSR